MYLCPACDKRMELTACAPSTDDVYFCDSCHRPLLATDEGFRKLTLADSLPRDTRVMFRAVCPDMHEHLLIGSWGEMKSRPQGFILKCPGAHTAWGKTGN